MGVASIAQVRRLSILIFHRVLERRDPLFPQEVDALRFDCMMRMVACAFNVLPLTEAARRLSSGSLPRRALAITFDDGYADNCDIAMPILRRYGLSATFFVATGFLDGGRMWNDTVIECLRNTSAFTVDLADFGLPRLSISSTTERRMAIDKVIAAIKYLAPRERDLALERLHALCGGPLLSNSLMMTGEQVRLLHQQGMAVGAHTVHHPILSSLPDDEARTEIADSRATLETLLGEGITSFAYPNGRPGTDYDQRHAEMVRSQGFEVAVSTAPGVSRQGDDAIQLSRFTPWDVSPGQWLARLAYHHVGQ